MPTESPLPTENLPKHINLGDNTTFAILGLAMYGGFRVGTDVVRVAAKLNAKRKSRKEQPLEEYIADQA